MTKKLQRHIFAAMGYLLFVCPMLPAATTARTISVNGDFEKGFAGWKTTGDVTLETTQPLEGKASARIGPGPGSISQRLELGSHNHIQISAVIRSIPRASGKLTVRFLDKDGNQLMNVDSDADMKPGDEPRKISHYMKPHPLTVSVELIISKGDTTGSVETDQVELGVYEEDDPSLNSTETFAEEMKPLWKGNTVYREAVMMMSHDGMPALGTLMFEPSRILSVTDYGANVNYHAGTDFTSMGRTLICTPHSRMTQVKDSDLLQGELAWNAVGGKQVLVTYEHSDLWAGPTQPYVGEQMPDTMQKLAAHGLLKIVAYGDSITFGLGSSRVSKIPPFQAPWIELFTRELQQDSGDTNILLYNSSQNGADSNWAKAMAQRMVATLDPDLVVIAFGQNDFWGISAEAFAGNISTVIETVRSRSPKAEFLLVSTMRFDPAYSLNSAHWNVVGQYESRLRALTGPGVQLVEFTTISGAVFAAKEPKDCLNDPLHPNDYLSRWYAQSLVAALTPVAGHEPAD